MAGYNQQYGSIFDAPLIEARINALDKKGVYNQENGASLEMSALAARLALLDGKIAKFQGGTQFDVADLMARLNALETPVWTPANIAFTSGIWLDQSDLSTGFQDSAGTTPITASGQFVGKRLDKSGLGNHVTQAGSTSRPEWDAVSGIDSDYFDGSNDGYSTASGITLANGMDLFLAIRPATTATMLFVSSIGTGAKWFGVSAASASLAADTVGSTWTLYVNGVQIGGTANTTQQQVRTAIGSGTWVVIEGHDLDLSTWTQLTMSAYLNGPLNADSGGLIICPAQSSANRTNIRKWLGAKVGLSL